MQFFKYASSSSFSWDGGQRFNHLCENAHLFTMQQSLVKVKEQGLNSPCILLVSVSNRFSCDTKISHFLLREFQINLNKTAQICSILKVINIIY